MITEQEEAEFNADARRHRAEVARRVKSAEAGDIDAIWSELTRPRPGSFDPGQIFQLLLKAVEVRARQCPQEFAAETLARFVSLTTFLALRSHYLIATRIEQYDRTPQGRGRVELPPTLTERGIPQLPALQASLAEMLYSQVSVARAWELARAKRIENDRAVVKSPSKTTGKTKAKTHRKTKPVQVHVNGKHNGNGKPANRITDLLEGLGSKANGYHGDE